MALTVSVDEIVHGSRNRLLSVRSHWRRIRLGEIASVLNGFAFKSAQFAKGDGMPLIRIRDVGSDSTDTNYVGEFDKRYIVEPGDLLVGMDGDFNCARWRGPRGLLNQRVCKVTLQSDQYHPRFLDFALPGYLRAINDATSSVTVKHLSSRTIEDIPLPFPPLYEQDEIVAELEKQFSRLDEAVANLKRVKANLGHYKAAVLEAAVDGTLVTTEADLAARDGRRLETGEQFLERVLRARSQTWAGKGRHTAPLEPSNESLPVVPPGWGRATWDQLSHWVTYGFTRPMPHVPTGVPIVTARHIGNGRIDFRGVDFTPEASFEELSEKDRPRVGDILITKDGAIGRAAVVETDKPFCINQSVAVIWLRSLTANPRYLLVVLEGPEVQKRIREKARGVAIQHLSITDLAAMTLPLPPLAEQERIVAEVDRRLSIVREVEAEVDANLKHAQALRQAVLARAFAGTPLYGERTISPRPTVPEIPGGGPQ